MSREGVRIHEFFWWRRINYVVPLIHSYYHLVLMMQNKFTFKTYMQISGRAEVNCNLQMMIDSYAYKATLNQVVVAGKSGDMTNPDREMTNCPLPKLVSGWLYQGRRKRNPDYQ
ncbi:MAG: hypothetical protein M8357_08015 [Desulfobulbaceae bacterium]|nr:hypothetical protein [Desulfobulbaceae bacterium]